MQAYLHATSPVALCHETLGGGYRIAPSIVSLASTKLPACIAKVGVFSIVLVRLFAISIRSTAWNGRKDTWIDKYKYGQCSDRQASMYSPWSRRFAPAKSRCVPMSVSFKYMNLSLSGVTVFNHPMHCLLSGPDECSIIMISLLRNTCQFHLENWSICAITGQ